MKKMLHLLNSYDLSLDKLDYILSVANIIADNPSDFGEVAKGKILATLFYEPSTRTRLSFESAMHRLGGSVVGFSDMSSSAAAKGETIEDTVKVVCCYCDAVALRHPVAFTPHKVSQVSTVPIINAGDGANEHPTQTLTDLCTIKQKFGKLSGLTVGLCGDLKYGRTIHSLIKMMARFKDNKFILISPEELALPEEIIKMLDECGANYEVNPNLEAVLPKLDVLYMTRIQKERFDDPAKYERLKSIYILDAEKMKLASAEMIVMHPLPRIDEITEDVDNDPRAWYFKQAQMGVYARMALLVDLLELHSNFNRELTKVQHGYRIKNKVLEQGA